MEFSCHFVRLVSGIDAVRAFRLSLDPGTGQRTQRISMARS